MRLHLRDYLRRSNLSLPPAPPVTDYSAPAAASLSNIYGNDTMGDCVVAAGYHFVGVATGNAGTLWVATPQQIISDYSAIGGFDPNNPQATDNGCDERTALDYWTNTGFADGTKLTGWAVVDGTNTAEVQAAMFLFENLFFGMELPDAWINPFPSAPGYLWDVAGAADPSNGHAVVGVGYNASGVQIDSWGMIGTLTYGAVATYAAANNGELYVMLSPDQLAKGQAVAPNGVAWSDLLVDLASLNGQQPAPPPPVPPPPVPPSPGGVQLGLSDVQALLAAQWPQS
jgi:hypothetical protein